MAREGSVVPAMSDTRRQQLQRDRLRTKAISLFLADHREALLRKLKHAGPMDYNFKRKALEHVARKKFNEATDSVQRHYMNIAGATGEGTKEGSGGSGEAGCETQVAEQVQRTDVHDGPQSSPAEMSQQAPDAKRRRKSLEIQRLAPPNMAVDSVAVDSGRDSGKDGVSQAALRGRLVNCADCLREIYGDAGGFETLAGGLRILDKVSVATWKGDDTVKVAAILGLAAKLTQTPEDTNHVRTLWAKIAGKHRERPVRDLEKKVFMAWARDSLESDYVPKVVQ